MFRPPLCWSLKVLRTFCSQHLVTVLIVDRSHIIAVAACKDMACHRGCGDWCQLRRMEADVRALQEQAQELAQALQTWIRRNCSAGPTNRQRGQEVLHDNLGSTRNCLGSQTRSRKMTHGCVCLPAKLKSFERSILQWRQRARATLSPNIRIGIFLNRP